MRRTPDKLTPYRSDIVRWERSFLERKVLAHKGGNGRPRTSQETMPWVEQIFGSDRSLSICSASSMLQLSSTTGHRIYHEIFFLNLLKLQNLQEFRKVMNKNNWDLKILPLHTPTTPADIPLLHISNNSLQVETVQ